MKTLIIVSVLMGLSPCSQAEPPDRNSKQMALLEAVQANKYTLTEQLISEGADVTLPGKDGFTALHIAASKSPELAIIKLLVNSGADVNTRTELQEKTALEFINFNEQPRIARYLIDAGTNINISLRYASFYGMATTVRRMLAKGASVNLSDRYGNSPIILAVKSGSLETVRLLIDRRQLTKSELNKLLFIATDEKYDPAIAELLIDKGADVNARDFYGRTALHRAVWLSGNIKVAELLIARGAKLNITDKDGRTPLLTAIISGRPLELIRNLINKETVINRQDEYKHTALHYAASNNNPDVVQYLIKKGADTKIIDIHGDTPLTIARQHQLSSNMELLHQ